MMTGSPAADTFGVFGTTAVLLVTGPGLLPRARDDRRHRARRRRPGLQQVPARFRDHQAERGGGRSGRDQRAVRRAHRCGPAGGPADRRGRRSDLRAGAQRARLRSRFRRAAGRRRHVPTGPACSPAPGWRRVHLDRDRARARLGGGAQLDLGATAKAWAADRCCELIARRLGCGALVSLGGDIAVAGPVPEGGWRVRVTDDHAAGPDAPGQTVAISSGGLATSSTTVRAWAIGRPARCTTSSIPPPAARPIRAGARSVSRPEAAWTPTRQARPPSSAAPARSAGCPDSGLPARLVRADGTVQTTAGWPSDDGPAEAI